MFLLEMAKAYGLNKMEIEHFGIDTVDKKVYQLYNKEKLRKGGDI